MGSDRGPLPDDGKPDIDALASFLSREAAKLRDSGGGLDDATEGSRMLEPQSDEIERQLFEQVGDGGFDSNDFEVVQQLGSISMQQVWMVNV